MDATEFKWLDPECGGSGCQSLVWKGRYESVVKGRQGFRQAFRVQRRKTAQMLRTLRKAADGPVGSARDLASSILSDYAS